MKNAFQGNDKGEVDRAHISNMQFQLDQWKLGFSFNLYQSNP